MKNSDREQIKKWVDTWERAGRALDEVKRRELRSYDYFKNQALVDEMLQWAVDHQKIRLTTGLVEQQRIFMKMREKQGHYELIISGRSGIAAVFFLEKKWLFCFIGGLAVIRWSEIRMTQDIDLSLLTELRKRRKLYIN